MTTQTTWLLAYNRTTTVTVDFSAECLACNLTARVVVRPTGCGRFAILYAAPRKNGHYRLAHVSDTLEGARNYISWCK